MLSKILHSKIIISLALFLLAFIPRLLDLGRFLTADEFLWVDRSRNFLAGLTNSAYQCTSVIEEWDYIATGLACTLRTGHPGVTTMWTGTIGLIVSWLSHTGGNEPLHQYVVNVSTNPLDAALIAPERFTTVLITSLWVVAVCWLLRRLFGTPIALTASLLIALNPFHIALSRVIHHDALSTTFMTLSVLTALIYWGENERRVWLISSGILAGFGFLSKSPALYLMPFIALIGLWFHFRNRRVIDKGWKKFILHPSSFILILDGLIWFACAVVIVFIFWPAMWVVPLEALETVFFVGSKYATGGHAKGNFFMGVISNDPGPLFYPVSWLFRASPLVLIGLISLPIIWLLERKRGKASQDQFKNSLFIIHYSSFTKYLPLILLFILGYYTLMTVGEKKQGRYFLPVYPWLDLLAAVGLVGLMNYVWSFIKPRRPAQSPPNTSITHYALRITGPLLAAILLINGFLVAQHFPYYFTYYNPLLGGPTAAAKVLTIGWGEGLDLAADYLNTQTVPAETRVSSWYQSTFAPFYQGEAISYSKEKGKALAGEYVIFYVNQVQRLFPDEVMFDYFTKRSDPTKVINLHGVDYVWIYPSLNVDHYVEDQTYTGIASLLAWQWIEDKPVFQPGQTIDFELYWEYLGKEVDEPFFFRLADTQGGTWAENQSGLAEDRNPSPENWREGEILVEEGTFFVPPGTPPGAYQLQIGFYTKAAAVTEGELLFDLPPGEATINVDSAPLANFTLPEEAVAIAQSLGNSLTLVGAAWPQQPLTPGESIPLDLYWRVEELLAADTELHLGLMNENGEAKQAWFSLSLAETFNPSETGWQAGDIILTRWQLELLPELPPGQYHFELVLPENVETTLPFGQVVVE